MWPVSPRSCALLEAAYLLVMLLHPTYLMTDLILLGMTKDSVRANRLLATSLHLVSLMAGLFLLGTTITLATHTHPTTPVIRACGASLVMASEE